MPEFPPDPVPGAPVSASWMRGLLAVCRACMPIAGPGMRASYTPNGTVLTAGATAVAPTKNLKPFTVRWHKPADSEGQWEVYLPPGCLSVGGTCEPLNRRVSVTAGHDDEPDWYRLELDESAGDPITGAPVDGNGNTVQTQYRKWQVVAHAKTSAKIYGEDEIDEDARRLCYVSAEPTWSANDSNDDKWRSYAGDEFSQQIATVIVDEESDGSGRRVEQTVSSAISAAGKTRTNFDLVWCVAIGSDNLLEVKKLLCVRNRMSIAGMVAKGDTLVDVSAAVHDGDEGSYIFAKIRSNEYDQNENIVEVHVDPSGPTSNDFTTWLELYRLRNNGGIMDDYRPSALTNSQVYR